MSYGRMRCWKLLIGALVASGMAACSLEAQTLAIRGAAGRDWSTDSLSCSTQASRVAGDSAQLAAKEFRVCVSDLGWHYVQTFNVATDCGEPFVIEWFDLSVGDSSRAAALSHSLLNALTERSHLTTSDRKEERRLLISLDERGAFSSRLAGEDESTESDDLTQRFKYALMIGSIEPGIAVLQMRKKTALRGVLRFRGVCVREVRADGSS
jgi:hypothetical protein